MKALALLEQGQTELKEEIRTAAKEELKNRLHEIAVARQTLDQMEKQFLSRLDEVDAELAGFDASLALPEAR